MATFYTNRYTELLRFASLIQNNSWVFYNVV